MFTAPSPEAVIMDLSAVDVSPYIFREYDLRGRVPEELTPPVVYAIARGFGTLLVESDVKECVLGYDSRSSSREFAGVSAQALRDSGVDVVNVGMSLSPSLYFSQHHLGIAGGFMVTASHNPEGWNGFKLSQAPSTTLEPPDVKRLREIVDSRKFASGKGTYREEPTRHAYVDMLVGKAHLERPLRVAVDCGNGTAGYFCWDLLQRIGCRVFQLYCDVDPAFPHHFPNPSDLAARTRLKEVMTHPYVNAEIGLGYDGDGDRLGVLDERGENVWTDRVLILLVRQLLRQKPGAKVVFDVKCTRALSEEIEAGGGIPIMERTGHSYIKSRVRREQAALGGERSGHIFFAHEYYGYDDALFASLKLLEYLSGRDEPVSAVLESTPQYVTSPEIHAHCPDGEKYRVVDELVKEFQAEYGDRVITVNGARVEFDDGWGLVRASSNLPELVLIFEAKTEKRMKDIRRIFRKKMSRFPEVAEKWENDIGP